MICQREQMENTDRAKPYPHVVIDYFSFFAQLLEADHLLELNQHLQELLGLRFFFFGTFSFIFIKETHSYHLF